MGWFWCTHEWYPSAVYHYRDTSYSYAGIPSTRITSRCLKCGKIHVEAHYGVGYLELSALQNGPRPSSNKGAPKLTAVK